MRIDADARQYAYLDVTTDTTTDVLDSATVEVRVGSGEWEAWEWTGTATSSNGKAIRTARRLLAGPNADPGDDSAVLLNGLGTYGVQWRLVGIPPEQPSGDADSITVD